MTERKRLFILILILTAVSLSIAAITINILYHAAFEEDRVRLVNIAQSRARLIESVARYDAKHAKSLPDEYHDYDPDKATMSQVIDAHENFKGFGRTGEFTLARREGDKIVFLLRHRHDEVTQPVNISFDSELAAPMRLALSGKSGTLVGFDYRREIVLAAYEPVAVLDLGIVAKIDLSEVRAPFVSAGITAIGVSILLIFFGAFLFFRVTNPIIKKIITSEENFRLLVSEVRDYAILRLSPEGIIESWNEGAQLIKGYTADEIVGERFSRFYTEADIKAEKPTIGLEVARKEGKFEDVGWRVRKDGTPFFANIVITALRDKKGVLKGFSKVTRDITESKQAEEQLRLQSEIIENMNEGVYLAGVDDGIIKYTTPKFERMFGYDPGEMIGKHVSIVNAPSEKDPEETAKEIMGILFETGKWEGEIENIRKDGTPFWCYAAVITLEHSKFGKVLVATHMDITERKRALDDRKNLETHLRQQQKLESIGTLAGGVAHEINNPINGIMNYARLISDRLDEDSPLKEYAAEIGKETERVATIVRNLLTFSRQEKETHSPASIKDIIDGTVSLVQSIVRNDQITLKMDIPDDLPEIKCRSQQIQQVLMNLLTNSRDALNERYPEFDEDKIMIIKVRPFEKESQEWIRMTVEDHGTGIPEKNRDRIFDPFFTTKDRTKGTGLGLSISYGIIEDHQGEMHVESEPGQYTRFHVDLRVNNGWTLDGNNKEEIKKGKA